ncbi:BRCT domain [Arabidopsis suecica]|uniref:DNA repair protein REV1 n=1 Tax=Arabidopsis suecica TaxID=45249 RepID=A0A8T1XQU3_ARASU|nr:BRCT domain [Arabidopsis suecica]KAG7536408.1 BRCT domain [Arabidopsis suecica]
MKRSLGSNSSNNSGSASNKKTKKKNNPSNQKTLGAAWGAASSRSSFQSSPFSNFGSYMEVKNRKLQNQFETEASASSRGVSGSEKLIFQGVSIFVDGFTIPSHQELRGYMKKYGGRFENYFSRRSVTHIICSNLPDSKVKNLRAFSRGLPVVKPTWIVDSISANRLLGWVPYQLDQLNDTQPKLSAFFTPRSHLTPQMASPVTSCQPDTGYSEAEEGSSIRAEHSEEARDHVDDEFDGVYIGNTTPELTEETGTGDLKSSEMNAERPANYDIEEKEVSSELQSTTKLHSASDNKSVHANGKNDGKSIATAAGSSVRRHSTLEDPNFVENYFKNSRLHFIGTWRNRYRKRFHGPSNGLKWADSGQNTAEMDKKSTIIHIDLDCFFVSVVIKNRLELHDKPVAVCHSDNPKGTAEISSANYPARAYGVKAGMFVRHAKELCPQLVIVPYNFEAYEEVADQFYDILHRHCRKVQALSCDEAFLDVSDLRDVEPEFLASTIRNEILETTGCSASAGIGGTMLVARLATRVAKPAGQLYISAEKVEEFLDGLPVGTLPGVGSVLKEKLVKQNIQTCGQLRLISKDSLQKDFGVKTGEMLWSYSRGLDLRSVTAVQESKSIGAEVNWGVRFRDQQDVQHFLQCLCKEVSLRLQGCEMIGRNFTLKIKKRKKDAEEPTKYMGCGDCDNLSRSITVPTATDDVEVLQRISKKLFGSFCLDVKEVRGVGLQVSKLDSADPSNKASRTLKSWLSSASASVQIEQDDNVFAAKVRENSDCNRHVTGGVSRLRETNSAESSIQSGDTNSSLPPMCHLDMEVLENLPPELLSELDGTYGGKLFELIEKKRGKRKINSNSPHVSLDGTVASIKELKSLSVKRHGLSTSGEKEYKESYVPHPSIARTSNQRTIEMTDLMPSSLSQVDVSVLQELPEELRADVLGALPAPRRQQSSSDVPMETCKKQDEEPIDIKGTENEIGFSCSSLWFGNPPLWTEKFKVSGNCTLEKLSEIYYKVAQSRPMLSPVLQHAISEIESFHDGSANDLDKAIYDVCELHKQYIKLKVEGDIEEIYLCFRLLKRLAARSQLFLQVYEILSPFIQASISEHYGGSFSIYFERSLLRLD